MTVELTPLTVDHATAMVAVLSDPSLYEFVGLDPEEWSGFAFGLGLDRIAQLRHDITDIRRADRIRRDFVSNVSHELRTPLTAIRGYVEALADSTP